MKKRMFITTIVMVLVLAVALTTSSLAWFSSANTTVSATTATFYASTAESNTNLQIGDSVGGWSNSIALTSGNSAGSMRPLIPTSALIPTATQISNETYYVWPNSMSFNEGKINSATSKFVVDSGDNAVIDKNGLAVNSSAGYYYDRFYLLNADEQNSIAQLDFTVDANLTASQLGTGNDSDYASRGYVAFILFIRNQYNSEADATAAVTNLNGVGKTGEGTEWYVFVPFAGFTFSLYGSAGSFATATAWQFADLDSKMVMSKMVEAEYVAGTFYTLDGRIVDLATNDAAADYYAQVAAQTAPALYKANKSLAAADLEPGTYYKDDFTSVTFANAEAVAAYVEGYGSEEGHETLYGAWRYVYNNALTTSLKTQGYDATNDSGSKFNLNTTNLRTLNNKVIGDNGNVGVGTSNPATEFSMGPKDIIMVDMYYWLDGNTLNENTDTTVGTIAVQIDVPQN